MNEHEFREMVSEALAMYMDEGSDISRVSSFREAGVMTNNEGLVIKMKDGSEFQMQIVQSK